MQTSHKFSIFPLPLDSFISRYQDGDEEVPHTICVDSLPTAKQKIRAHLESILVELTELKMRDIHI